MEKMTNCKACGNPVAKGAKACPMCGKDSRSFFQKHKILTGILAIFVIIILVNALGGDKDDTVKPTNPQSSQTATITPAPAPLIITADELMSALDSNPLNASNTYKNTYVQLTGKLSNIDSSGKYFTLFPENEQFALVGIMCYINGDDQKNTVASFTIGQSVTVVGTITDVGEVIGYSLEVDTFK